MLFPTEKMLEDHEQPLALYDLVEVIGDSSTQYVIVEMPIELDPDFACVKLDEFPAWMRKKPSDNLDEKRYQVKFFDERVLKKGYSKYDYQKAGEVARELF